MPPLNDLVLFTRSSPHHEPLSGPSKLLCDERGLLAQGTKYAGFAATAGLALGSLLHVVAPC